jgi:hypothetical protein
MAAPRTAGAGMGIGLLACLRVRESSRRVRLQALRGARKIEFDVTLCPVNVVPQDVQFGAVSLCFGSHQFSKYGYAGYTTGTDLSGVRFW